MALVASVIMVSSAGLVAVDDGVADAVADVLVEEADGDGLERLGDGADLGEDVDAVRVLLDHALDAADLALDAVEPLGVVVLVDACSRGGLASGSGLGVIGSGTAGGAGCW